MAKVDQFMEDISTHTNLMLDTNTIIYFLDGVPEFVELLTPLFEMIEGGHLNVAVSVISEAELLVKPYRSGDTDAIEAVMLFLNEFPNITIIPVSREISRKAAEIRANLDTRLPDAIILATALNAQSDLLLGNDLKLMHKATTLLPTIILNDYI
jgi:predicted nucleic acid-binding protein